MKIWFRFLFQRLLLTFLFFLLCFFVLYVMIDLSAHGVRFLSQDKATLIGILLFYWQNFLLYLQYFASIALLLASLKVLTDCNAHCELVALQMAGLSKKTLLLPFFTLSALLSLGLYATAEWLTPSALEATLAFRAEHSQKKKIPKPAKVSSFSLGDDSEIVYQSFDAAKGEFFDVFWIKSGNDLWHMKYLRIHEQPPEGRFVDHLQRNASGLVEKTESFATLSFPSLSWKRKKALEPFVPFENRPLSTLLRQALTATPDRPSLLSHLHYKLALPLFPFLLLLGVAPMAMRFGRAQSTFLLVALSLFISIGAMVILDGMLILGESHVLPSFLAIWGPLALLFLATWRPFAKL